MPDSIVPAAISSQLDSTGEERIHMANMTTVVREVFVVPNESIYFAYDAQTYLRYNVDDEETDWSGIEDSEGLVSQSSAATRVHFTGGMLFRLGTGVTAGRSRVSSDGDNWVNTTGSSFTAAVETVLKVDTEWQFYQGSSNMLYSTDGIAMSTRALGTTLSDGRMAIKDDIIIGLSTTANTIARSTDGGATWSTAALGGTTIISAHPIATTNRFIVFGRRSDTEANILKWSTTGAAGTWTQVALPGSLAAEEIQQSCWNPDTERLIVVRRDKATYYSDDEGDTWVAGLAVPDADPDYFTGRTNMLFANSKVYYLKPDSTGQQVKLYTTVDGTTWTQIFDEWDWGGDSIVNMAAVLF